MKWIKKVTESEHSIIKLILENDNGLKITAIVIAIFMFITVNQIGNPIWKNYFGDTEYIEGIPLNVEYDTENYVVSGVPQSINVNISGSENNVQSTLKTKDNLVATLPLNYKSSGSYTISSDQVEFNNTSSVQISPATSSFEINIQDKKTESRSVDIGYINGGNRSEGILLNQPELMQKVVEVTGGVNDVANVVSVRGQIDLNQLPENNDKNPAILEVALTPYDKQGDVVTGVSVSPNTIGVSQSYEKGTIPLPIQFNYPNDDNSYVKAICEKDAQKCEGIDQMEVNVYGEKSKIKDLKSVTFNIDKNTYNEETSLVNVSPVLESGVFVQKGSPTQIQFKAQQGVSRTIQNVQVKVINLDKNLKIDQELTTDVQVVGPKSEIEKLKAKDINLTVDAKNITEAGTYDLEYQKNENKKYNVNLNGDTISVTIKKEQ